MKSLFALVVTTAALSLCGLQVSEAKTFSVANIGHAGLKAACGRGGGNFHDTAGGYACEYKNGNIRECNSKGQCIIATPK